jgi:hypothetical protein
MSTVSAAGAITVRPSTVTAAAVLLIVLTAVGLVAAPLGVGEHGASFAAIAIAMSAIRGIAAFGVWRARRWAAILAFVISSIDVLLSTPGFFDGSSTRMQVVSAIAVPLSLAILILLAWPSSRRVYA